MIRIAFIGWSLIFVAVASSAQQIVAPPLEGKASYYARSFQGRKTASGELFNNHDFTAAHRSYPFGTYLNVVNKKNNLNIIVRVNDRGPFVKNRIIDLTESAARRIGGYHAGLVPVRIEVLKILRHTPEIDSMFQAAPYVDCFGKPGRPEGFTLSLWSTTDLIHAIYIAADTYVKEDFERVYITSKAGSSGNRSYHVVVGDISEKGKALEWKSYFEKKGFMNVTFFND